MVGQISLSRATARRRFTIGALGALLLVIVGMIFLALTTLVNPAHATPPQTMNFQGRLMDSAGTLLPDGNYNMQFRIYTTSTGGSALWTETR